MTEKKSPPTNEPGRFAYEGLESVFLSKARLGILTSLLVHPEGLLFGELKELCSLTDGNLSRHLHHLQEEKPPLIEVWKRFKDNRPQTLVRITSAGQARFREYLAALEAVIADAAAEPTPRRRGRLADGAAPA
jgi:DNA-binding MarR family transcriptional regulator